MKVGSDGLAGINANKHEKALAILLAKSAQNEGDGLGNQAKSTRCGVRVVNLSHVSLVQQLRRIRSERMNVYGEMKGCESLALRMELRG